MCERPPRAAWPRPSGGPRRERGWQSGPRGSRQPGPHPPSAQLDRDAGAVRAGRRRDGGRWWPATHARPGTRGPGYRACRWRARRSGSWPRPPAGQRALGLQGSDLGFQQLALEQHLAQLRLQALGLQRLAVGGPRSQARFTGRHEGVLPSGQGCGGDAQGAREYLQVLPRNRRRAASRLRWRDMRPPRPRPIPPEAVVSVLIVTLPRITSAYRVSQPIVERSNGKLNKRPKEKRIYAKLNKGPKRRWNCGKPKSKPIRKKLNPRPGFSPHVPRISLTISGCASSRKCWPPIPG